MKVSKYYLEKLNKAKIERFGNEEKQIENAREFLKSFATFPQIIEVPNNINPTKVVQILRKTKGIPWACVTATYEDCSYVYVYGR